MPIWHQSPKLTPRYFLETPRLFGYPSEMALLVDLVALSIGLHGSVQMDSVALFLWIGWLCHHGILKKSL